MKIYKKPELKITKFEIEDIVTTSVIVPDIDGASTQFPEGWEQSQVTTTAGLLAE